MLPLINANYKKSCPNPNTGKGEECGRRKLGMKIKSNVTIVAV
jgi:hypothetical protein